MTTLKCDICGRFVRYRDIPRLVVHRLIYPDSAFTAETWETYHRTCEVKS
jgi:hypothetical protein